MVWQKSDPLKLILVSEIHFSKTVAASKVEQNSTELFRNIYN